ncbi:MAG: RagB/SusD family nutrient uptake outer membrane protein [Dysgonamonadaceae bacterium]|jgi:hypothetical protein|nr:RagB/SusD family nutrient uptake outer membrane protein [Dysgonamonadaceae bacterium]
MKTNIKNIFFSIVIAVLGLFLRSCESIVESSPPSSVYAESELQGKAEALRALVTGLYTENLTGNGGLLYYEYSYLGQPVTDDVYHNLTSAAVVELNTNTYSAANTALAYLWQESYRSIFHSNNVIRLISETTLLTEDEKAKYIGEAKYFRAFHYFLLTSFYGNVPLITSLDIVKTTLQPRDPKETVVRFILNDLLDAEQLLAGGDNPKVKITEWAAKSLLARQYLYAQKYDSAEIKANDVITNSGYTLEADLDKVFLRQSTETIFTSSSSGSISSYVDRTYYGYISLNNNYFRLDSNLIKSFEPNDLRATKWVKAVSGFPHQYKYKKNAATSTGDAEDQVFLRLAEQFLIRAEARAQRNNLPGAIADIDTIRTRAGLDKLPQTLSKEEILLAIENERRHELFIEEAHRWWDLTRTGRAGAILGNKTNFPNKQWEDYKALWPVPQKEIEKNPNLEPQNPGYGEIN